MSTLLTTKEVARWLHVSLQTVRHLTARGELKVLRIGSVMRFREEEVRAYLLAAEDGGAPKK